MWVITAGVQIFVKISESRKCTRGISVTRFFTETKGVAQITGLSFNFVCNGLMGWNYILLF